MIMKKVICLLSLLACLFPVTGMAQGLHFGLKAGVLGNKADIHGMSSQIKEENQTGFQVGPMLQYQTGFYGLALDFSLLYVQRGVKLTNTANGASTDDNVSHELKQQLLKLRADIEREQARLDAIKQHQAALLQK